jgi:phosphoglycolate phosphatase
MLIEGILFDLDGTLIDSKRDLARSIHDLQRAHGLRLSSEDAIGRFIGDGVEKLVERATGIHAPRALSQAVKEYKAYYRRHALEHTRPYPGVKSALRHFRKKKMAVVTNKPAGISKHIIKRLGIQRFFGAVIGGDSVRRKKPAPDALRLAMKRLRLRNPQAVLMVGDSEQDVRAGRSAKVRTCGVISNIADIKLLKASKPDFTINSLRDLTRIIN